MVKKESPYYLGRKADRWFAKLIKRLISNGKGKKDE